MIPRIWRRVGLAALLAAGAALAQEMRPAVPEKPAPPTGTKADGVGARSTTLFRTYSTGTGASFFRFSLSTHGNVIELESPFGFDHLFGREGYALCVGGVTRGYDRGAFESGFSDAVFQEPLGPNQLPVSIDRVTVDGRYSLTQVFDWDPQLHALRIVMTVRNNTAVTAPNVELARYFDGDLDNTVGSDFAGRTFDSAWIQESTKDQLTLTAVSFAVPHVTAIHSFGSWNWTVCTQASTTTPTSLGDWVGRVTYRLGDIPPFASATVTFVYRRS